MATRDFYLMITRDCIHNCIFCSVPKTEQYLSLEQIKKKIDRYSKLNYTDINLTGGEPTLHPQLKEIIRYGADKGFDVRMTSNGVKLADFELMKSIKGAGLGRILFSVHHYDPKKAMFISGIDEPDLNETIKGIDNADRLGMDININITIIRQNYTVLPQIISMLVPRFKNIHHFNFNFVDITGNVMRQGKKLTAKDIAPRYSEVEKYLVEAFRILKSYNISFRFERAPLCYAPGFEAYNSYANRAVGMEFHATSTIGEGETTDNDYGRIKSEFCKSCNLNDICFGVEPSYNDLYGTKELYPVFANPNKIEAEIKRQNKHKEIVVTTKLNDFKSDIQKLFNHVGGIDAVLRRNERYCINGSIIGEEGNKERFARVVGLLIEFLKDKGYEKDDFSILCNDEKIVQKIEKTGLNIVNRDKRKAKEVYDSKKINSLMLPEDVINSYGIINIFEISDEKESVFRTIEGFISDKLKGTISNFKREDFYHALLDIYSVMKHKIKVNIGFFKTKNFIYLSLSRDLAVQEYLAEAIFNTNKPILDLVSIRELGPEDSDGVEINHL